MKINFQRGWRRLTIIISSTAAVIAILVSSASIWPTIKSENENAAAWNQFKAFVAHPDRFIEKSDLTTEISNKFGQEDPDRSTPPRTVYYEYSIGTALRSRSRDVQLTWLNDSELGAIVEAKYPKYRDWLMDDRTATDAFTSYKYAGWDEYATMFALPPLVFLLLFGLMRLIEWLVSGFIA
jgi:hypothetical protein